MAQERLQIKNDLNEWVDIKQPDSDGYNPQLATTDSETSARTLSGFAHIEPLFTVSGYSLKWTNISAVEASKILSLIVGKASVDWHYFNVVTAQWETAAFYTSNFSAGSVRLIEGQELWSSLSFDITLKQGF